MPSGQPGGRPGSRRARRALSVEVGALLDHLARAAAAVVDAPAAVAVVDGDRLVPSAGTSGAPQLLSGGAVEVSGTVCGAAVSLGQVVRTGRVGDPASLSSRCCPGARSHLAFPLVEDGRVLGLLTLTSDHEDWFDDGDEIAVAPLVAAAVTSLIGQASPRDRRPDPDTAPVPRLVVPAPTFPSLSHEDHDHRLLHGLGLWSWDAAAGRATCSPAVSQILGVPHAAAITLDQVRALVHPEDRARFEATLSAHLVAPAGAASTYRVIPPSGGERHVQVWAEMRRELGELVGAWGAVLDVTQREKEAAALRSSLAGLRAAQELTGLGVWEWHPYEERLAWSPEMFRFVGLEPGEVHPTLHLWHSLIHPEDLDRARRLDVLADEPGGNVETFRVIGVDGAERHLQSWSTIIPADGSSLRTVAGATVDVTRQVQDRQLLELRSSTDPVTGLANRLGFDRRMQELLADQLRDVALLLLDLDRFKLVNDSLGHQVGDRLLVQVARRLESVVPGGSLTARMGGDEFVVVPPPGLGWRELRGLAQGVVDALRQPFELNETGEVLVCPASVGVTATSGRDVSVDELLSEADLALYRAKDSGRDRYVVFDDALRERARYRHRAERLLRSALEENRLVLEYQPIVDFLAGRVVGAEALVRMRGAEAGELAGPEAFVDVAEDTGLVVQLDCWVIESALDQLARWSAHAPPSQVPWLAVNVSPRSVEHPRVVHTLINGLRRRSIPARLIKVELTEHSFLSTLPGGEAAVRRLIEAGVPVGIDDFGTGYSALAYLPRFQLDFMKIDKSFVNTVGQDARADAVVTAIVALAHAHGMKVTAEGIETSRQARRLREIGCDFGQGYHFGRPAHPSVILRG